VQSIAVIEVCRQSGRWRAGAGRTLQPTGTYEQSRPCQLKSFDFGYACDRMRAGTRL